MASQLFASLRSNLITLRATFLLASLILTVLLRSTVVFEVLPTFQPKPVSPLRILMAMSFGAVIGYCANRLAIWMLFNPAEPVRLLGLEFQGLIPKKRAILATKVADIITSDILSEEEVEEILKMAGGEAIREALYERLSKLPLPPSLAGKVVDVASSAATLAAKELMARAAKAVDLRAFIVEKANSLDPRDFSKLFHKALGKELRWISLWDSMLGAIMGLAEALLFSFLGF